MGGLQYRLLVVQDTLDRSFRELPWPTQRPPLRRGAAVPALLVGDDLDRLLAADARFVKDETRVQRVGPTYDHYSMASTSPAADTSTSRIFPRLSLPRTS